MSGWSIVHAGRRLWAATKADARKLAQILVDETGKKVTVRPAAAARKVVKRNPVSHRPAAAKLTTYNEGRAAFRRGWGLADNPYEAADLRNMWIKGWRAARDAKPAAKPARRVMRRNPDPGAFMEFMRAIEIDRANRRAASDRAKPRRLAKIGRGRGARGTGGVLQRGAATRFAVDAANRKERLTLYRATRAAANALAREFEAAGYRVAVREA